MSSISDLDSFYTCLKSYDEKELKYGVKALGQKERKFVLSCVKQLNTSNSLINNFASAEKRELATRVIKKISSSSKSLHKKSNILVRIWKGFLNLMGLRVCSRKVVESVKGKRLTQKRLKGVLEELQKFQEENPTERVNLVDFLKKKGFTTKLKNLNFAVDGLTVTPQARLPFGKPPSWGSDILKKVDITGVTFQNCEFEWVNFSESNFTDVTFANCNFQHSVNVGANFNNCKFINSYLGMSCFESATMKDTKFLNCNIDNTTFYKALIEGVRFLSSSLSGAVFLDAQVKNDSEVKDCNLKDCYFFDTKPSFKISGKTANCHTRPLMGVLWNHHKAGIAGNKISHSIIRNGGVPFKIHFDHEFDKKKLDDEVKQILAELADEKGEKAKGSIPFRLIQKAKEKNDGELKKVLDLAKNLTQNLGGLVLPGGDTDIPPELYGETTEEKTNPDPDYLRIVLEFAMLNEATVLGLPVMGICRGCQVANVFFGGNLKQHVTWQDGVQFYTIDDEKSAGILPGILNKGHIRGFTNHHQANKKIAEPLAIVATHGEVPKVLQAKHGSPMILTQFHPEFSGDVSNFLGTVLDVILTSNNEEIFQATMESAKTYQDKKAFSPVIAKVLKEISESVPKTELAAGELKQQKLDSLAELNLFGSEKITDEGLKQLTELGMESEKALNEIKQLMNVKV